MEEPVVNADLLCLKMLFMIDPDAELLYKCGNFGGVRLTPCPNFCEVVCQLVCALKCKQTKLQLIESVNILVLQHYPPLPYQFTASILPFAYYQTNNISPVTRFLR